MIALEGLVKVITLSLGIMVEGVAAIIIAIAILRAFAFYVRSFFSRTVIDKMEIRMSLGKALALSLEFLLAADILRTAVAPNWDDIGKLAAIAALRTLLNYSLERELKHSEIKSK